MQTQQYPGPIVPTQAPSPYAPYQAGGGAIDINTIMNLMLVMVIMVMMMGFAKEARKV